MKLHGLSTHGTEIIAQEILDEVMKDAQADDLFCDEPVYFEETTYDIFEDGESVEHEDLLETEIAFFEFEDRDMSMEVMNGYGNPIAYVKMSDHGIRLLYSQLSLWIKDNPEAK